MSKRNQPKHTLNQRVEIARKRLPQAFELTGMEPAKAKVLASLVPDGALSIEIHRKHESETELSATAVRRLLDVAHEKARIIRETTAPTPMRMVGRPQVNVRKSPSRTERQGKIPAVFRQRRMGR